MTRLYRLSAWLPVAAAAAGLAWLAFGPRPVGEWFITSDQQAQHLFDTGDYAGAAARYSDPVRAGVAQFRAGDFKPAAASFMRSNTATAHYNRGNALVLTGQYEEAVEAYDRALDLDPDRPEALNNREIATLRAARLKKEGGEMTGGMMGADEIVFEPGGPDDPGGGTEVTEEEGAPMSDAQLQALWLRRVQTRPAQFLRSKFAYQLAMSSEP